MAHTLVLGSTGSGKSFLLNFLVTNAQHYQPFTVVLDLGHSYRKLTTLLRKAEARTLDAVRDSIRDLLHRFTPNECANYFRTSGYAST